MFLIDKAHMGLHSRLPFNELYKIALYLKMCALTKQFNIYNYSNPESEDELLHNIRKAKFYGILQKNIDKSR